MSEIIDRRKITRTAIAAPRNQTRAPSGQTSITARPSRTAITMRRKRRPGTLRAAALAKRSAPITPIAPSIRIRGEEKANSAPPASPPAIHSTRTAVGAKARRRSGRRQAKPSAATRTALALSARPLKIPAV